MSYLLCSTSGGQDIGVKVPKRPSRRDVLVLVHHVNGMLSVLGPFGARLLDVQILNYSVNCDARHFSTQFVCIAGRARAISLLLRPMSRKVNLRATQM